MFTTCQDLRMPTSSIIVVCKVDLCQHPQIRAGRSGNNFRSGFFDLQIENQII